MKKRSRLGILLFSSAMVISALSLAAWDDGAGDDWKALLAKAKQEGPVVFAACPEFAPALAKAFKADTGLDAISVGGSTNDLGNRFRAEVESGRHTIDIRMAGSTDIDEAIQGRLYPLRELLVLPGVLSGANWKGGKLAWVDNAEKFMVMPQQYVSTRPIVNRDIIGADKIRVLSDLLKPEFKGKIIAFDPLIGGAGQSAATYFAAVLGVDFIEKLFKGQQVVISSDFRQMAESVARGVYPIALGLDPIYVELFRQQGVTSLALVTPQDAPGSLNGGCSVAEMPKTLPHPAGAQVFVNWYLSANGQKALVEANQLPSRRTDVPPLGVPEYFLPDPKIDYLDQYQQDWYLTRRTALREAITKVLAK